MSSGAPLDGIAVAVSRRTAEGEPEGGWTPARDPAHRTRAVGLHRRGRRIRPSPKHDWGRIDARRQRGSGVAGPRSARHAGARSCPPCASAQPICAASRSTGPTTERQTMTTPTNSPSPGRRREHEGHLKRALGLPSLVLFGLVYMVPLTVFTTYGIVTEIDRRPAAGGLRRHAGRDGVHRAVLRADGGGVSRSPGSAYTYTQRTFGAPVGFLAGWSLLLDYLFLPMLNYLVIGIYLNAALPALPDVGHRSWSRSRSSRCSTSSASCRSRGPTSCIIAIQTDLHRGLRRAGDRHDHRLRAPST